MDGNLMKKNIFKQSLVFFWALFVAIPILAQNIPKVERAPHLPVFADIKSVALENIHKRGVLRVGVSTSVPWAMRNKEGELIGFEIDVATRLAKDSGWKVEFIPTAWDGIIPALLSNKTDVIIAGMSVTPERSKSVLFTQPYSRSGVQVAVNKKSDVKTLADLNSRGIKIAARRGTYVIQVVREHFPKAKLFQFDDEAQAFQEVLNGNADAVIAASPKPEHEAIKHPETLYLPFKERLAKGNEAFAVRLGEKEKQAFFDAWINARMEDGWLQKRYDHWFSSLAWENQL